MKNISLKFVIVLGLVTSNTFANQEKQNAQRIILAVKKTIQRKKMLQNCSNDIKHIPAEVNNKLYLKNANNVTQEDIQAIKSVLQNKTNKEFIIESLVCLFCDKQCQDSLDNFINTFTYIHANGVHINAYNKAMNDLKSVKKSKDLGQVRKVIEKFIDNAPETIKKNIKHMIEDKGLVTRTNFGADYSQLLQVLTLRLANN